MAYWERFSMSDLAASWQLSLPASFLPAFSSVYSAYISLLYQKAKALSLFNQWKQHILHHILGIYEWLTHWIRRSPHDSVTSQWLDIPVKDQARHMEIFYIQITLIQKLYTYVYELNLLCGISHYLPCFPWFSRIWFIHVSGKEREQINTCYMKLTS